jgi:3-oxoacyl-[acyl-carrier protein] reductase
VNFVLEDRVAIITGGARGIGLEHARTLAAEGSVIVITDIDDERCANAVAELQASGYAASGIAGDASDETVARHAIAQVMREQGRVDILVNNAGIGVKPAYLVEDMPAEAWDDMIRVHMKSSFLWSRSVIAEMKKAGFGRIINTSSMNFTGGGRPGVANYSAAKAGIVGFTQTLAKEVGGYGITVNAVAPGYVATDLISQFDPDMVARLKEQNPLKRLCQPSEVAAVVAFLCSVQAAFINGECICIDGGRRDFYWG